MGLYLQLAVTNGLLKDITEHFDFLGNFCVHHVYFQIMILVENILF